MDEGQTKFTELTQTTIPEPPKDAETTAPPPPAVPSKPKRKSVKTIVAK
jgi:hypothetical protein